MSEPTAKILVIEDEHPQRAAILRLLGSLGYAATGAADGQEAIEIAGTDPIALAIVDLNLPDIHGFALIERLKVLHPSTECIILTGTSGDGLAIEARAHGASDYFEKPIGDMRRFQQVIRRAFEVYGLRKKIGLLETGRPTSPIVGVSAALEETRTMIERVAGSSVPVLITGESGVGKEVVAEALHERSHAKGEFVRVNCAAVPASLIEAELFGAEEGTYTGQRGRKEGLLAIADGGTLFLDEIGDMPFDLQPKLLRALESRRFRPLGSQKERELTARVVAATNVDLEKAVATGKFRDDLYFRLAVITLHVIPLRERPEDVPVLLAYFVRKFAMSEGREPPVVPDNVAQALMAFHWPGNVRQLSNAVLRAMVLSRGGRLELHDFGLPVAGLAPPMAHAPSPSPAARAPTPTSSATPSDTWSTWYDLPLAEAKEAAEIDFLRAYLREHLRRVGGNITRAAEATGVLRPNFKRTMRRCGVSATGVDPDEE